MLHQIVYERFKEYEVLHARAQLCRPGSTTISTLVPTLQCPLFFCGCSKKISDLQRQLFMGVKIHYPFCKSLHWLLRRSYKKRQVLGPFKQFTAVIGPNGASQPNGSLVRLNCRRRA